MVVSSWAGAAGGFGSRVGLILMSMVCDAVRRPRPRGTAAGPRADKRGRLRGQVLLIGCVGEVGVPAPVVVGEGVVEYRGADLE